MEPLKLAKRLLPACLRLSAGERRRISSAVLAKALALGASQVGIASVQAISTSPSHRKSCVLWPPAARSVIVVALAHPPSRPADDWWDGKAGRTAGNRRLIRICSDLADDLRATWGIQAWRMAYTVGRGGLFVKDAAVLAGLGCIGRNNLLVTPAHGPRVRLGAVMVTVALPSSRPSTFAPCDACHAPCQAACPQGAFPSGIYAWQRCNAQMQKDVAEGTPVRSAEERLEVNRCIKYCRACELACPVGR